MVDMLVLRVLEQDFSGGSKATAPSTAAAGSKGPVILRRSQQDMTVEDY